MSEISADTVNRVRDLYAIIVNGELRDDANSVQKRVTVIEELEQTTHKRFRTMSEFHNEVSAFLAHKSRINESIGTRIRRVRRKAKLTQDALAGLLHVTRRTVINWETNATPPSPAALEWLNAKNGHQGEM